MDQDADGFNAGPADCDDADPLTHAGAPEQCDGNDNDCVGGLPAGEADADMDGFVACSGWTDPQGDDPGILGGGDSCPTTANPTQADFDGDGLGDACETGTTLADANRSGRVDGFDLSRMGRAFAQSCGGPRYDATVDLDRNCDVDGADLALLAVSFGLSP